METFKVRIVKYSKSTFWYADCIGEVFEVFETEYPKMFRLIGEPKWIQHDDCIRIQANLRSA